MSLVQSRCCLMRSFLIMASLIDSQGTCYLRPVKTQTLLLPFLPAKPITSNISLKVSMQCRAKATVKLAKASPWKTGLRFYVFCSCSLPTSGHFHCQPSKLLKIFTSWLPILSFKLSEVKLKLKFTHKLTTTSI